MVATQGLQKQFNLNNLSIMFLVHFILVYVVPDLFGSQSKFAGKGVFFILNSHSDCLSAPEAGTVLYPYQHDVNALLDISSKNNV